MILFLLHIVYFIYMIKYILLSCSILMSLNIATAQNLLSPKDLELLDNEISQKSIYDKVKTARIDSLKNSAFSSNNNNYYIFEACLDLGKEYETFISDSALFYFDKALHVSRILNDSSLIIAAELGRIKTLAILGYFKEGITSLNRVEATSIPESLITEWLDTSRQLYAYMCTYAYGNKELYENYSKLLNYYRDKQIQHLEENSPTYKLFLAEHFVANQQLSKAKLLFSELIEEIPANSNIYARAAHNMASIKKSEGKNDVAAHYMALAAISDIKCSVKETMAIQELAIYLYNKGDIKHAYNYISSSLSDAVFCNARLRTAEVSKIIPLIDGAYKKELEKQRETLVFTNFLVGILTVGLIIIIVVVVGQSNRAKQARQELKKANSIKEEYIGHFLDICSIYMERLDNFSKIVTRKITAGQVEELLKMAKTNKFTEGQHKQFYDIFDATFLHIYPTFIDEFNNLLIPEEQIIIKEPGHLTTELRIYAFLRMGVEDSTKIASFLNYSVNTIYTYRNKIKSKAKDRETFETSVMKIGSFS